jgi:hypothetical protein
VARRARLAHVVGELVEVDPTLVGEDQRLGRSIARATSRDDSAPPGGVTGAAAS